MSGLLCGTSESESITCFGALDLIVALAPWRFGSGGGGLEEKCANSVCCFSFGGGPLCLVGRVLLGGITMDGKRNGVD